MVTKGLAWNVYEHVQGAAFSGQSQEAEMHFTFYLSTKKQKKVQNAREN